MIPEWLIVLNADGTVLAVNGGAPPEWVGIRVDERDEIPPDVRRAAAETRRQFNESVARASLTSTIVTSTAQPVRLVVLDALPMRRVATDLRVLLESTLQVMERQARAIEVALTLEVDADLPHPLHLDPDKIAWTITALVGNALRFVRRGTRLRPGGSIRMRARYTPAPSRVILEVQDDGSGIPEDALSELLQRRPEQLHASGLALTLVQDVIEAHGGAMQLESSTKAEHSGTTVRLTIPCP